MKKVLIIGNQGYLGSHLTNYLDSNGFYCKGIDTGFFREGKISKPGKIETKYLDARHVSESEIFGFDSVVLLAGISNDPFGQISPVIIYDTTREYALKIARFCKKMGSKFIYPSSCSVYGAASYNGLLNEEMVTNPQTPYSINKLQVEEGLRKISDNSFLNFKFIKS